MILDFVLSHVISILFLSGNGIPINQRYTCEFAHSNENGKPLAALYPKAIPIADNNFEWKKQKGLHAPCIYTTGRSITLLSKTYSILSNNILDQLPIEQSTINDFNKLSKIQLAYCMEVIYKDPIPAHIIASVLEGCLNVIKTNPHSTELNEWAEYLYDRLKVAYQPDKYDIPMLCQIAKTLTMYNSQKNMISRDELVSKIALEIISCKNKFGLLGKHPYIDSTAPISDQFLAIDALLSCYPIVQLDTLYEEAFYIFNNLYNMAYNPFIGYFTFGRDRRIRYTALDLESIIRGLNTVYTWTEGEEERREIGEILDKNYITLILDTFFDRFKNKYDTMISYYKNEDHFEQIAFSGSAPVFPSTIFLEFPGPVVKWPIAKYICIGDILSLCSTMLDNLENTNNTLTSEYQFLLDLVMRILHA